MKFHYCPFILLAVTILSCADTTGSTPIPATPEPRKISKPPCSFSDTLVIDFPSAVFYSPDSLQQERIKGTMSEGAFESGVHDCLYLEKNSRAVLQKHWAQVQVLKTSRARYLLFRKKDKGQTLVDLDTKGDICGLFLFDGKKEPELADMMNVDTALEFYFSR